MKQSGGGGVKHKKGNLNFVRKLLTFLHLLVLPTQPRQLTLLLLNKAIIKSRIIFSMIRRSFWERREGGTVVLHLPIWTNFEGKKKFFPKGTFLLL